jgi:uncharacterized membrane protein YhaH (DUF805 family)
MEWYVEVIRKYATFTGRARRREYWMFVLFNILASMVLGFFDGVISAALDTNVSFFGGLYSIFVLIPSIAVGIRRLHDTDRSGWWLLLALVPLANIVLLIFLIEDGTQGPNQYGADPKTVAPVFGAPNTAPAGWLPDPTGRHQYRYWDATRWTHYVSDNGVTSADPIHP